MRHAGVRIAAAVLAGALLGGPAAAEGRKFEWTTKSAEARALLAELQARIENFQFGAQNIELARRLVAADPQFAIGQYYLSATVPPPGKPELDRAVELARGASDGERRFIEAMAKVRASQGATPPEGTAELERLAVDFPGERLVQVLLGQIYAGSNQPEKARAAFEKAQAIGPPSNRVRAFLANDDLLHGRYRQARESLALVEKELPRGSTAFLVRYGLAFAHLYEGDPDAAIRALETYLAEYRDSGAAQGFPEVFIWNSIARIHLENGRAQAALQAYEKGYESVPGSSIAEDQKEIWRGRLLHGKCRTLAKMGRHEEAWKEAETIKAMIEKGGEPAKQFWPAYHYLAGYLMLERGEAGRAVEHLKQASVPADPFHTLLLARAYERIGDEVNARKHYGEVVASRANGLERALAYNEAKRKLTAG